MTVNLIHCKKGQKLLDKFGSVWVYEKNCIDENSSVLLRKINNDLLVRFDLWGTSEDGTLYIAELAKTGEIHLSDCKNGDKLMSRSGRLWVYSHYNGHYKYPHVLINQTNNIHFREVFTESGKIDCSAESNPTDIAAILDTPEIDLNTCVPGQKLYSADGTEWEYKEMLSTKKYPHILINKSSITPHQSGFDDSGLFLLNSGCPLDIVRIAPIENVETDSQTQHFRVDKLGEQEIWVSKDKDDSITIQIKNTKEQIKISELSISRALARTLMELTE